jgi:ABC-type ATPase with predicted acetyltransferase domain
MAVWRCSKCGNSTSGNNKPLVGVCTRGGGHRWIAQSSSGTAYVWRCGKCGNSTTSANRPLDRICNRGGKCSWRKQS